MNHVTTLGLLDFYEAVHGSYRRREMRQVESLPQNRTFVAYIARSGHMVVRPYQGEAELASRRQHIRSVIGTFGASDIAQARTTANKLRGL